MITVDYGMIGYGVECNVYNIGNGICYKYYDSNIVADCAYKNAIMAFNAGIGPAVYDRNDYGYETEIVGIFADVFNCGECKGLNCKQVSMRRCCDTSGYDILIDTIAEIFDIDKYQADLHVYNIGIKDGKYIMIDFGECSGLNSDE